MIASRPDGLITGTTHWVSYGPDGGELFRGTGPLLGARDFGRLVIEEVADDETHTPQMVFHCGFEVSTEFASSATKWTRPLVFSHRFRVDRISMIGPCGNAA